MSSTYRCPRCIGGSPSGQVQIKKGPHGRRHRVYVVMEDVGPSTARVRASNVPRGREGVMADWRPDNVSLAVGRRPIAGARP